MMDVFHRLYLACAGGTGIFMILSAVCFVKLDIRTAWRVLSDSEKSMTGKKKAKSAKRKGTDAEKEQNTILLRQKKTVFRVEREIMLVHTEEIC